MAGKKVYVVWQGKVPGIYHSWAECQEQTKGFKGAKFKSFASLTEAQAAYEDPERKVQADYIQDSLSVDAACAGNPGEMEYQGVHTKTQKRLFGSDIYPKGTNNIGEFLGIVDGLRYLKEQNSSMPIYSDSQTAIAWVRNKAIKTNLEREPETLELWKKVDAALAWLEENEYSTKVFKWETHQWGEVKADFGRK